MLTIDLHNHTLYSHGQDSPAAMFAAARQQGLELFGFSEHSPRPLGYDYTREYREQLTRHLPDYVAQVRELQERYPGKVLLGMEMDWLGEAQAFVRRACTAYDFDYLLGSVHFVGTWGFDDQAGDWEPLTQAQRFAIYERYFLALGDMARSGLFQIASHPDLIKIFSLESFRQWLQEDDAHDRIRSALLAIRDAGMAMEISSAGLRKICKEIYPCPAIMRHAADLKLSVSFGSDAHAARDVGYAFDTLEAYARSFGFSRGSWFCKGQRHEYAF